MQVVILAGGLGTRLRAVTGAKPKALVPVVGRPFVEHQFDLLRAQGFTRVLFCAGYGAKQLAAHVGDGSRWGLQVSYSLEAPDDLLGTAGALVHALPQLEETFFVLYGDSYLPTDYRAVAAAWRAQSSSALMTVFRNRGQWDLSNVRTEGGRVVFYSKRAAPGEADYIDYGLSVFRRDVFAPYAGAAMPLDLATVQGWLVEKGQMAAFEVQERFYEVGKPEGLAELEAYLAHRDEEKS